MVPPPLKPPVRAKRIRPFHTSERQALTHEIVEELFRSPDLLTEGGLSPDGSWYGSIMITFDLELLAERCRGLETSEAQESLLSLIAGSVRVRVRAHRIALQLVGRRFPDRDIGTAIVESRFHRRENLLLLDVDLEVPIRTAPKRRAR